MGSKQRRLSLGDIRKIELEAARRIARQRFAEVVLGNDPAEAKAKLKAEQKVTYKSIAERYLASKENSVAASTYAQMKLHLQTYFKSFDNKPITAITRADIAVELQTIAKDRGPIAAGKARMNLCSLFSWSMKEGLADIEQNPVINTNDPGAGATSRNRVLNDQELALVWSCLENDDFGKLVKLLVLSGARRSEIGGLQWSEIDMDSGVIRLPPERTKTGQEHILKLPPMAVAVLKSCHKKPGREYLFGNGAGAFKSWSGETAKLRERIATVRDIPAWNLHDIRRTVRSGLGKLGIRPDIAELVIGHKKKGIIGVYDLHQYEREIAEALKIWADHVSAII
jgi:integrase